jgi:hypothetical protein
MDRERLLGPAVAGYQQGESFIEEHDRRWAPFGVMTLGLAGFVAYRLYAAFGPDIMPDGRPSEAARMVSAAAEEIRPQLPVQVDDVTTFTAVEADGARLILTGTIARDLPSTSLLEAENELQRTQTAQSCMNPQARRAIAAGARIEYRYTDASGDRLRSEVLVCPAEAAGR